MTHSKPITTTLKRIKDRLRREEDVEVTFEYLSQRYKKLFKALGKTKADDEPIPYSKILEINGIEDALWCTRAEPKLEFQWRSMALDLAREVRNLMRDKRSLDALDVAERYLTGQATHEELLDAWRTAWDAVWDARGGEKYAAEVAALACSIDVCDLAITGTIPLHEITARRTAIFLDIVGGGNDSQR